MVGITDHLFQIAWRDIPSSQGGGAGALPVEDAAPETGTHAVPDTAASDSVIPKNLGDFPMLSASRGIAASRGARGPKFRLAKFQPL